MVDFATLLTCSQSAASNQEPGGHFGLSTGNIGLDMLSGELPLPISYGNMNIGIFIFFQN